MSHTDTAELSIGGYTAFGYHSARQAERDGRSPGGAAGAAAHDRVDREKLIAQSRAFRRNNGLYGGIGRAFRQLVHGGGFGLNVRPASSPAEGDEAAAVEPTKPVETEALKRFCAEIEADWRRFWKKPDVRGRLSGRRIAALVVDEIFVAGDVGVVLADVDGGKLQVIEAEQVKGPNGGAEDGIEKDEWGRPTKYFVCGYDPRSGTLLRQAAKTYGPESFLLIGAQDRASSSRAIPPLQASFPNLHRLDDIATSEAISRQMQAKVALSVNRKAGAPLPGQGNRPDPNRINPESGDDLTPRVVDVGYGLFIFGEQGDEVKGLERTAAGGSFRESHSAIARLLGLPIGMPLELIIFDWTQNNYSQTRAVIALCADAFGEWQLLLEEQFYAPVLRWRIERQVRAGKIGKSLGLTVEQILEALDELVVFEWMKPAFPWIDLLAEAQASGELVQRGFQSYSQVVKSQNGDPEAVSAQQDRDVRAAIKRAKAIEKDTGVLPPWQAFCGMPIPGAPGAAAPPAPAPSPTGGSMPLEQKPGDQKPAKPGEAAPPPAQKQAA